MEGGLQGKLRQSDQVVARQIADQWLLIPLHATGVDLQKVYLLNETSAAIWRLLDQPTSLDDLVTALRQEYDAPEEVIRQDADELVTDLMDRGFVVQEAGDE